MKFRGPRYSLAAKFSLLISLPVLMVSLALTSSFIRNNLIQIETAMRERGKSMARDLSLHSKYGLLIQNNEILDEVINTHTYGEDLLYIAIRDVSGEILASHGQVMENMPANTATDDPSADQDEAEINCCVAETDLLYDVTCDVVTVRERRNRAGLLRSDTLPGSVGDAEKIGSAQIGLSKAEMIASMRRVKRDAFGLTAGAITLVILMTVLLVRLMVDPIKRLAIAAEKVSCGNFDHSVEVKSKDEIGELAESFNRMMVDLKRSRKSLQHRLEAEEHITRELEEKTEELSRSNEELDAFVYTVSHDLKAPLVSLQGFSSLMIADCGDQLDENGRMYIQRIQKNTERMGDLIENLLKLSRIGRIKGQEEPVDISGVVSDVADELAIQLQERGIALIVNDHMPTVLCHRTNMSQIFANLVGNANKYIGEDNENPIIEVGYSEQDSYYTFYVKDNGIGIAEEYHEKIFQILQRLNETEAEGAGMGLTIVKKIVEGFGGRIWLDSAKGKGTTMYFTVPKAANARDKEGAG